MLTRELTLAEYDFQRGCVIPDRLTAGRHGHYEPLAEQMLHVYRTGIGQTRRDLHRRVRTLFADETECPHRRIDAFCKLLDDAATFARDTGSKAAELRRTVFRLAAASHPLVSSPDRWFQSDEGRVKANIAQALGSTWPEIERDLFADVLELQCLQSFSGYVNGRALLARYNVAQVQAVLYDAVSMKVWASDDFKTILRYVKLARLMHTISRTADGRYAIQLDGPASVLGTTRRYGVQMARFLPALIACRGWQMHAMLRPRRRGWTLGLDLSADDGLHSHLPSPEDFDSHVEEVYARRWGDEPRDGWSLYREAEVLHHNQKVFVPDFVFRNEDGRKALLEIIGYWTPEYLEAKRRTLELFRPHNILLAVAESVGKTVPELWRDAIRYKSTLRVQDVLERLKGLPRAATDSGRVTPNAYPPQVGRNP